MSVLTTKDIAILAGVSRATVSRVINDYPNVSADKVKKVKAVIKEHGYVANTSARALAGKANNIIELVLIDINKAENEEFVGIKSPYFNTLVTQLINEAKKHGYLLLINTINNAEELALLENNFSTRLIYGAIIIGMEYGNKEIYNLVKKNLNIVTIDVLTEAEAKAGSYKTINTNDEDGAYDSCKILIDANHQKIAYIGGDNRLSSIKRHQGYLRAMHEHHLTINPRFIKKGDYSKHTAYLKTLELFNQNEVPTAIFVANDLMSIGVIEALNSLKLQVPKDISLITIDNGEFFFDNGLKVTNFAVNIDLMAKQAVELILNIDPKTQEEIKLEFNQGNSIKSL